MNKIEESDRWLLIKEKYEHSIDLLLSSDHGIFIYVAIIINSKFFLVDFDYKDSLGSEILINKNIDLILDELERLILLI